MRTRNGLEIGPRRVFGNDGYSKHSWILASRHYPWSITWSWALYWTRPGLVPLWRWVINGFGFYVLTQEEMPWEKK
jgi:hypothetical protein